MINLDLCDRVSLTTLLANVWFLQRLCHFNFFNPLPPAAKKTGEMDGSRNDDLTSCLCLPVTVYSVKHSLIISYPFYPYGSAYELLSQQGGVGLSEELVCAIVSRAFLCLDKLHSNGLLHRNLCSRNLLLTENEKSTDTSSNAISVKFCGLGSLVHLSSTSFNSGRIDLPPIDLAWRGWHSRSHSKMQYFNHPVQWYAPEMVAQDFTGYSWASDIYSLGLVIFELFTGRPPFPDLSPTQIAGEKLQRARPPALFRSGFSVPANEKMQRVYAACTEGLARKRPSVGQILTMPWIRAGLERPFTSDMLRNPGETESPSPPPVPTPKDE